MVPSKQHVPALELFMLILFSSFVCCSWTVLCALSWREKYWCLSLFLGSLGHLREPSLGIKALLSLSAFVICIRVFPSPSDPLEHGVSQHLRQPSYDVSLC